MVQPRSSRRSRRRGPRGFVPLARRAGELGMSVAALRRYVNLGSVDGQIRRVGRQIYVASDLVATPTRRRQGYSVPSGRHASLTRETTETRVSVELDLDGRGQYQVRTGNGMLDHLLAQLARHSLFDLTIAARGDGISDAHHLVEDVAITLGRALRQAVGEGRGIRRMGNALVPLDEALAQVAVDFGGRGYAVVETRLEDTPIADLGGHLVDHFLERLALEGGFNLHARILAGSDPHHKAEALFKALARALRDALEQDPRAAGEVPSTKGTVSG